VQKKLKNRNAMFAVIYSFKIKKGEHRAFEKYRTEATHFFRDYAGGLGSRLHSKSEQEYIAYAQ
jgi:antibiotic biosynthesis monooxygenase (ABM) superfamily enzyme